MKIGLVSPYPVESTGGVQNHVRSLYAQYKDRGHDVKIISPHPPHPLIQEPNEDFIRIGQSVSVPVLYSTNSTVALKLDQTHAIRNLFKTNHFDILHFHSLHVPFLLCQVLELSSTVNVITIHTAFEKNLMTLKLLTLVGGYLNRKIHGHIAVSKEAEKYGQKLFPGEYRIIPNGVDLKLFSPASGKNIVKNDHWLTILFVGRIERRKGLSNLIYTVKKMIRQGFPLRLVVVGDGPGLSYYKNRHKSPQIMFAGEVKNDQLPPYYDACDIFCSPTIHNEAFGIVLLEAMAMEKPIIAGNNGGYRELIQDRKVGILINPSNTAEFIKTIKFLSENVAVRSEMGQRGRIIAKDYTWSKISDEVLSYYQEILNHKI